jgi:predicted metal-binding protein
MELKNKLSLGAKRVEYLMEEYFNREKTLGFCKACPNFSKYWSCPPYAFNEAIFLKQFKYMHIIGRQFEVPREDLRNIRNPEAVKNYSTDKLQAIKVMTWKTLLEIEDEVDGVIGLIPGNCPICETQGMECARKINQPCRHPKLMRFSLESLGFNVADLLKYEVGMTIQWGDTYRLPEVLTSVSAILCNEEIPKEILKKYFPDKKKSWEKKDQRNPETEFHTSETIKPEETIHGGSAAVQAKAKIIDDEIPPYRPQKSWVGYKAEKNPEDDAMKKGYTVTIQGEEQLITEKTAEEVEAEKIYDEESAPEVKAEEAVVEVVTLVTNPEPEVTEVVEEDDSKYQWLGFKAPLDDDEIVKRPIPKMTELILDGEEVPAGEDAQEPAAAAEVAPEEDCTPYYDKTDAEMAADDAAVEEPAVGLAAVAETVEEVAEAPAEEEDDSKYQWLGFKAPLDDDEPIVKKSTLASLKIPE